MAKDRITYVDLIKGLCIIVIVIFHVKPLALGEHSYKMLLSLPVFFFASGLFFKDYGSLWEFLRRKVNSLVVPLIFFLLIGFIYVFGRNLLISHFSFSTAMSQMPLDPIENNSPMWFLLVLFEVSLAYYFLQKFLPRLLVVIVAFAAAITGYLIAQNGYHLYLYLDLALIALPFFVIGHETNKVGLLRKGPSLPYALLTLVAALVLVCVIDCGLNMYLRLYPPFYVLYTIPFLLAFSFVFVGQKIKEGALPVLSFFGKYSLIVLGTHFYLIGPLKILVARYISSLPLMIIVVVVLTLALEYPIILLLKKYAPRLTGQSEMFKRGWRL